MGPGRRVGLVFAVAALSACAGSKPAERPATASVPAGANGGKEIVVSPQAMSAAGSARAAWLIYGVVKAGAYDKQRPPPANESADDFYLELAAREAMLDVWSDKHDDRDLDLERQLAVRRAGYLPELVLLVYGRPGWTVPGAVVAKLRLQEFVTKFAGEYSGERLVVVKPASGKIFPDVPGGDFPDFMRVPAGPQACGIALDERRAAWERWERLVPRLGGRPISASSSQKLGRQLLALKRETQGPMPDITWVSERVARLAFMDGFCAVEVKDWKRAVAMLGRAVALDPDNSDPRLELSGALAFDGQLQEGLRHADAVIRTATDACTVGRAWRKRGYILIEMESFAAARVAYEKSLVVDPGNPIALSELKTIAQALKQPGDWRTKPQPGQPEQDPVVLTTCRESKPADK
jgi:hypothetical protein